MGKQFILGSGSPRRQQILQDCGYTFDIIVSHEEEIADASLPLEAIPEDLAAQKARHILPAIDQKEFVLLTTDTVVILEGEIIGKPADLKEAAAILRRLSGKTHTVVSGVCLTDGKQTICFSDRTDVDFRVLSEEQILYYIQNYEVLDKAGAYAIQEWIGLIGIASIHGSYYNVMGLPIHRVHEELGKWGVYPYGN